MTSNDFILLGGGLAIPLTISDLVLWLRADSIGGIADGDPLPAWMDLSRLENHAVAPLLANRPTYKTGILNGKPVVRFDGLLQQLIVTGLGTVEFSGVTEGTLFAVFGPTAANYTVVGFGAADSYWRFSGDGKGYIGEMRATRQEAQPSSGQPTSGYHYHTIRSGPASGYEYRQNGVIAFDGTPNWGVPADLEVGGNALNPFTGDIGEVIVYAAELADIQVEAVEAYLASRWGL
jgi:hypothetical protein